MLPVEISNQGAVHDEPGRHPTALVRTVALPINKVLKAPAAPPGLQKPPHREHLTTSNDPGRRRGGWDRRQGARDKGLKVGDMKRRVNTAHGQR